MRDARPRARLLKVGSIQTLATLALLASLAAIAGCSSDSTKPGLPGPVTPQANFEGQLDPAGSSFVLTRVPGTQPGQPPVEVELIGGNLVSEPDSETISLDVSIRNLSQTGLSTPAQVWLGEFRPAGIGVLNADYVDPPIPDAQTDTVAGPTRFGFDYSSLVGPDGLLSPGETSRARTWKFHVPGMVSFSFSAAATFGGQPGGPTIGGLVFNDLDGDGVRDSDEPPFNGGITLQGPDGVITSTGTLEGGTYRFPVRDVGLHTLTYLPPQLGCACEVVVTTANPLQVVLLPDENGQPLSYLHADFGARVISLGDVEPILISDLPPDSIRQDPYRLADAGLSGDVLMLRVQFSGCTQFHGFPLFMSGGFMESNPVQARLVLGHDDHGEPCDAFFERTLRFDLTPLRRAFEQAYGRPGPVLLQLVDLDGNRRVFRYSWGPPVSANLLPNGSFEREGQPTLEGWEVSNAGLTSLVPGGAPDGGSWALRLQADWAPTTGFVRAPVAGFTPGTPLRLSAWVRAEGNDGGGMIYLKSGSWQSDPAVSDAPAWAPIELTTVPPISPGDTLWVVLSSLHTEIAPRAGLFDRVVLEKLPGSLARR